MLKIEYGGNALLAIKNKLHRALDFNNIIADGSLINIDAINNYTNLTKLNLYRCNVESIVTAVSLTKLSILELGHNLIDNATVLSNYPDLLLLNLSANKLSMFPAMLNLRELISLNLSYNKLSSIDFHMMPALTIITLNNNEFTYISESIKTCKNLKALNLNNNKITHISESLAECTRLTDLCL